MTRAPPPSLRSIEATAVAPNQRVRGVVSQAAPNGRIETAIFAPPAPLSDVVAQLWRGRWDLPPDAPHTNELLSDPAVNLVFERGDQTADARVVGVWTRLWTRTLAGKGQVRGIKLKPGAVRAFFPGSAHELTNRIAPLSTTFGALPPGLHDAIIDGDDDTEAFRVSTQWLESVRRTVDHDDVSLATAIAARISGDKEITTTADVARVSGVSPRPLQRLFRLHVGATPKWVIRRERLREAATRLQAGSGERLADLAAQLGYADQAHFCRDFRAACGRPPSHFST